MFQRMLKEETEQIHVTEESIYTELELFESTSLQQVSTSLLSSNKPSLHEEITEALNCPIKT